MSKVMLGYTYTKALLLPLDKLMIAPRGLVRDMMDYYLIGHVFCENPTAEEIAFYLCEDLEYIQELWDERTRFAWIHAKRYMDTLIDERKSYNDEKVGAGIASGEARKDSVTVQEAESILGPNIAVYNSFIENWPHKKVTSTDCEKINSLISNGKVTSTQLINGIINISEQTPTDKRDYMKSVSSWLAGGCWVGKPSKIVKNDIQPAHLNRVNNEAKEAYLKNKINNNNKES